MITFLNLMETISGRRLAFRLVLILSIVGKSVQAQISINTDDSPPDPSAILDLKSSSQGLLTPRMTAAQREAIANPATSLLVYQTDGDDGFYYNQGTPELSDWVRLGSNSSTVCDARTPIDSTLFQDFQNGRFAEYLIDEPGSYFLTGNIEGLVDGKTAITITSDDVSLDLNGYSLIGARPASTSDASVSTGSPGNGYGIWAEGERKNITIHNGIISSWGETGVQAEAVSNSIFRDLQLENNGVSGIIIGDNSLVLDCQSTLNLEHGIVGDDGNNVLNCSALTNGSSGIVVDSASQITNTGAEKNLGAGIEVAHGGMLLGCVAGDNQVGFVIGPFSQIIKSIALNNSDDGFQIGDQSHALHCNASNNEGDGFEMIGASGSIQHCVSHENNLHGIFCSNSPVSAILVSQNGLTDNDLYGIFVAGSGALVTNNRAAGHPNNAASTGVGDGNYDLNPATKYGPIIDIIDAGDVSGINYSDNRLANYSY